MRAANFDIHELINDLRGTCATISEKLPEGMEEDDLTQDDHATIDGEIFKCEECGWWDDISEQSNDSSDDEPHCKDCRPEKDDD